ncbi:MAG: PolC-type DNA polymerase III, partial [Lachnospiraceae bacterium]|nr:PolC-type DNA polymerase III [Lachnospiraceae bacterium]
MKAFFEAFPNVQLPKGLHDLMEQTVIEKITTTKAKDFLRIYLVSKNLIEKRDIHRVEKELKKQLFPNVRIDIKIYERFELSAQYTPEKLLDAYRESILEELMDYSHVLFVALKNARFSYPEEGRVIANLEDSVLVRGKEEDLRRILEKILVERCGFGVKIELEYREKERTERGEEEEQKISRRIAEITRNLEGKGASGEASGEGGAPSGEAGEGAASGTASAPGATGMAG